MNSFLVAEEKKDQAPSSVVPRVEEGYGVFVVTADLDAVAEPELTGQADAKAAAPAANTATSAAEAAK